MNADLRPGEGGLNVRRTPSSGVPYGIGFARPAVVGGGQEENYGLLNTECGLNGGGAKPDLEFFQFSIMLRSS
jgi:hypothetical protein